MMNDFYLFFNNRCVLCSFVLSWAYKGITLKGSLFIHGNWIHGDNHAKCKTSLFNEGNRMQNVKRKEIYLTYELLVFYWLYYYLISPPGWWYENIIQLLHCRRWTIWWRCLWILYVTDEGEENWHNQNMKV